MNLASSDADVSPASETPLVSVVVIGRNEGTRLADCLSSIRNAHWAGLPYELIYVDSASTDNSMALANSMGAHTLEVRTSRPSAASGRNAGWREARGEFVMFLDGDTILNPDFISRALGYMSNSKVAVVWGHRRERAINASLYNRILDLDWIYKPGETAFCGGDALMRRSVLQEVNGFNPDLIAGEEPELCRRMRALGYKIYHPDISMTEHDLAIHHFSAYWRRAVRAGHAYSEISSRFSDTDDPFWYREARQNVRDGVVMALGLLTLLVALLMSPAIGLYLLGIAVTAGVLVVFRTMWRNAWKSDNLLTLALYAIHSHVQKFPILLGQLAHDYDTRAGRQRGLIEYK